MSSISDYWIQNCNVDVESRILVVILLLFYFHLDCLGPMMLLWVSRCHNVAIKTCRCFFTVRNVQQVPQACLDSRALTAIYAVILQKGGSMN